MQENPTALHFSPPVSHWCRHRHFLQQARTERDFLGAPKKPQISFIWVHEFTECGAFGPVCHRGCLQMCGTVEPLRALEIQSIYLNLGHSDGHVPTGAAFFGVFGTVDPTNDFSKGSSQI